MKKNVVLIGMPAVGKSTVGVILAKIMGYKFVDTDILIQQSEKRLLREIIASEGTDKFIEIESRINESLECTDTVIATGGSVIYGERAMQHLREIGTVVYLRIGFETLSKRLKNIKNRGVVCRGSQDIHDIYLERTPLYEKYAHIIIDTDDCGIEKVIDKIIDSVGRF